MKVVLLEDIDLHLSKWDEIDVSSWWYEDCWGLHVWYYLKGTALEIEYSKVEEVKGGEG